MKITATQTFLDDRDRFEEGETYDVDEGRGTYFVRNGWATAVDVAGIEVVPTPQEVTLDIEPIRSSSRSRTDG